MAANAAVVRAFPLRVAFRGPAHSTPKLHRPRGSLGRKVVPRPPLPRELCNVFMIVADACRQCDNEIDDGHDATKHICGHVGQHFSWWAGLLGIADRWLLGGKAPKPTFIHFTPSRQLPPYITPLTCLRLVPESRRLPVTVCPLRLRP
jgi:hypothetical protein